MARERVCTISRFMSPNWAPSWAGVEGTRTRTTDRELESLDWFPANRAGLRPRLLDAHHRSYELVRVARRYQVVMAFRRLDEDDIKVPSCYEGASRAPG